MVLRAHEAADWPTTQAIWTAPAFVQTFGGPASTVGQCWHRLLRYRGLWGLCGYGYWAITLDGRHVGDVGFARFERGFDAPAGPELGWALHPDVWGQGMATEAGACALRWLDEATPHATSWCLVAERNHPSLRVAEKLGFVEWGAATFGSAPSRLLMREQSSGLSPHPSG